MKVKELMDALSMLEPTLDVAVQVYVSNPDDLDEEHVYAVFGTPFIVVPSEKRVTIMCNKKGVE